MNYVISGIVVKGDGYGRKIGFPTVNLDVVGKNIPEDGVYAGVAFFEDREYKAGIVVGPNGKVEAHLIGASGDIYGKEVRLEIRKFLRAFQKFETEEELIGQIKKDIEKCLLE